MNNLMNNNIKISPSLFAADIFDLRSQIEILERSKVDLLHIDVMDGNFVSRMAFGAEHIQMIKRHTKIPLDVHLMVKYPERHISDILEAGADIITIHQESMFFRQKYRVLIVFLLAKIHSEFFFSLNYKGLYLS